MAIPAGAALAQPGPEAAGKVGVLTAYLIVIDDNCPKSQVALAFPRDEHLKIKQAVKAEAGGAYATAAKEFENNSRIVGPAGACDLAVRKAQESGANTTNLVAAKEFFAQQHLAMMEAAQLRFADDFCKRLTVDWKAENARLQTFGLDANARHVKGVIKKTAADVRSRHRHESAPFCLELYGKWSAEGLLKTKE